MAAIYSPLSPSFFLQPTKSFRIQTQSSKPSLQLPKTACLWNSHGYAISPFFLSSKETLRISAVAEEASVSTQDPSSEAARRLYVGNIPRTIKNSELKGIVEEHGAVEKAELSCLFAFVTMENFEDADAIEKLNGSVMYDKYSGRSRRFAFVTMKTVEDANAVIEKLNGTEIGGREIKVNVTEKPLQMDLSLLQVEESQFIDSPHKVYVGNLAKTVTSDTLNELFSEKGKVLSTKVSRMPGTSKSSGFGFVSFSSDEDVEAAISSFNNAVNSPLTLLCLHETWTIRHTCTHTLASSWNA
ncbi:hypothetical protein HHK36_017396 [Tetracentron sinense]|uniref:Small ribosomal subunit protein cS22 n=1 Tax=Tetracentron sinense TaxID=13715 RepID=A0A834Z584_TETSI|nr:hypothetical protein HHK36_017392 [Tetracentron sinense]KAF8398468.1 hypothetical protein HHK36_017396 [Tetracentron sinense]